MSVKSFYFIEQKRGHQIVTILSRTWGTTPGAPVEIRDGDLCGTSYTFITLNPVYTGERREGSGPIDVPSGQ